MTGKELRVLRKKLGWTQVELAKHLGITGNTVARWERSEIAIRDSMARLIRLITARWSKGK